MRFSGSRRARAVSFALTLVVVGALAHVSRLYGIAAMRRLVPTALAYVQEKYHRAVAVERVDYGKPGVIVVEGLKVARGETFRDGNLVVARRIRLTYDPYIFTWSAVMSRALGWKTSVGVRAEGLRVWKPAPKKYEEIVSAGVIETECDVAPLFQKKDPDVFLGRIDRVRVRAPYAAIRRARDGSWSFDDLKDLIPKDKDNKPGPFRGEVVVSGATLDVEDALSGTLPSPVRNRVTADATIRMAAAPVVQFTARGAAAGVGATAFDLTGRFNTKTKEYAVTTRADARNVPGWIAYLGSRRGEAAKLTLLSGSAGVTAVLSGRAPDDGDAKRAKSGKAVPTQPEPPRFNATVVLRDGAVRLPELPYPVRAINATVTATPRSATLDGAAEVSGIPLTLSGEVLTGTPIGRLDRPIEPVRFNARVTSAGVAYSAVKRLLALPVVRKQAPDLKLPSGLSVPRPVTLAVSLTGTATPLKPETLEVAFTGDATLPETRLAEEKQRLTATGARAHFEGRYDQAGGPVVTGTLDAGSVRYRSMGEKPELAVEARAAHTRFDFKNRLAQVDGQVKTLGGTLSAQGWVDLAAEEPEFYVTGKAEGIDAARVPLPKMEHPVRIGGRVSGEFVASGTAKAPTASAYLRATSLSAAGEKLHETLDEVTGRVRYAGGVLEIAEATVLDHRARGSLSGTVGKKGELQLLLAMNGVDLARAAEGRTKEPVRGSAFVNAVITGTTGAPHVEGDVQVYQPGFRDYAGDYAQAHFIAEGQDKIQVLDARVVRAPEELMAERVTLTHVKQAACGPAEAEKDALAGWSVEGNLVARNVSVARAARLADFSEEKLRQTPLMGELEPVKLSIAGPLTALVLKFDAAANDCAVNGFDVGRVVLAGTVDLGRSQVQITSAKTDSAFVQTSVSGAISFDPKAPADKFAERCKLALKFSTNNVKLVPLLREYAPGLLQQVDFRGTLRSVDGTVTGTAKEPKTTMRLALTDVLLNQRTVRMQPVELTWAPGVLTLRDVNAAVGSGAITGYCAILLDEQKSIENILNWLAGEIRVSDVPVAVVRQLIEDSPFYQTESARGVRDALAQWKTPVGGDVRASIRMLGGSGALAPPPLPGIPGLPAPPREPPKLEGEISIPNLASPPGPDANTATFATNFKYQDGRFDLSNGLLTMKDGSEVKVAGFREEKADQPGKMQFAVHVKDFHLRSLAYVPLRAVRKKLAELQPLDGTVTIDGEVTGTPEAPRAAFTASVDHPLVMGVPVDRVTLTGGKAGLTGDTGAVEIDRIEVAKKRASGDGEAAIAFSEIKVPIRSTGEVPLDAERRLRVQIPPQSITLLNELASEADARARQSTEGEADRIQQISNVLRQIAATRGEMEADVTLGGTFARPNNKGFIAFREGVFKLQGLETEIKDFAARVSFHGEQAELERFTGQSSVPNGGYFNAQGAATLSRDENGTLSVAIDGELDIVKFKFVQKKVGALVEAFKGSNVRGMIETVSAEDPDKLASIKISGVWPKAAVSGGVKLDDARLVLNVQELSKPTPPARTPFDDTALDLRAWVGDRVVAQNVATRNAHIGGALLVGGTMGMPRVTGELLVSKARVTLGPMPLRNVGGTVKVDYDRAREALGFDASKSAITLDISGHTILRSQRSLSGDTEIYDATVYVRGNPTADPNAAESSAALQSDILDNGLAFGSTKGLEIRIVTEPPLPPERIMALVRQQFGLEGVGGSGEKVASTFQSQIEQALASGVGGELTARIEDYIQSRLGLTTFSIDLGVQQASRVRMGRRIYGPLFGSVTQEISGFNGGQRTSSSDYTGTQQRYELYYQVSPRLRVGYRRTEGVVRSKDERDLFFFSGSWSF